MNTRKICATLLAAGLICSFGAGNVLSARAEEGASPAENAVTIDSGNAELFLPGSKEEYLPLETPSDAAFSDRYIAVADKETLYVFDRESEEYARYVHTREISKIQFSDDGRLFFADRTAIAVYEFDAAALSSLFGGGEAVPQEYAVPSATFYIESGYLYAAAVSPSVTSLYALPLNDLSVTGRTPFDYINANMTPRMTFADGMLYCVSDSKIYTYNAANGNINRGSSYNFGQVNAIRAFGGGIYYTTDDGIYRTDPSDLTDKAERVCQGSGFTALTVYANDLYCIQNRSVRKLNVSQEGVTFSDYEIGSSSSSLNRLSGATQSVRARDLLVTADAGNERVSVYDTAKKSYSVIDCGFTPSVVSTDGETVAVASERSVYLYQKDASGAYTATYTHDAGGTVRGVACVYGTCYYITANMYYGKAEEGNVPALREVSAPAALTSDIYGNLYVARADGNVYRYTETEFTDSRASGEPANDGWKLPSDFVSLRADYRGNLYYLSQKNLYQGGKLFAQIRADECVYLPTNDVPVSFALGFEDNALYFNYGNFAVKSEVLSFPALNAIEAEGAQERIFSEQDGLTLVTVQGSSVGFRIDIDKLKGEEVFPYSLYYRTDEAERGILLGKTSEYSVVALFEKHKYNVNLFRNGDCTDVPAEEYLEEKDETYYLASDVSLSLFPCLIPALRGGQLPRTAEVTLRAVVGAGETSEYDYAYVEYAGTGKSAPVKGYVPLTFLTKAKPHSDGAEFRFGTLKANADGTQFRSEKGETLLITQRTEAQFSDNGDGTYTARIEKDGAVYYAQVSEAMIERPSSDMLRISLIVILSVLFATVVGVYFYLRPRKKK